MKNKTARMSTSLTPYICKFPWPETCFCQAGNRGLVFTKSKYYYTAFFEAFPKSPDTFIRGEGKTIEESEANAWKQYQKVLTCKAHEFERRNYTNGAGFCKHCGLFAPRAFQPSTKCKICNKPTDYATDNNKNWYCKEHNKENPDRLELRYPHFFKDKNLGPSGS